MILKAKKTAKRRLLVLLVMNLALIASMPADGRSPAQNDLKTDIVKRGQGKYYSLYAEGLKSFECSANLNWDKFFKDDEAKGTFPGEPNAATLKLLKFTVNVDGAGAFNITRPTIPKNGDKETEDGVKMAVDSTGDRISGFFSSWSPFVFGTLFPDPGYIYRVDNSPTGYHLYSKDAGIQTELFMDKDLAVSRISVTSESVKGRTDPSYSKTSKGLLVNRLDSYLNGGDITSTITIEYQEIQGLSLPKTVLFDATVQGEKQVFELDFFDYQVKK